MMYWDLKPGEAIRIGESMITVQDKSGRVVRLRIDAPQDVKITVPAKEAPKPQPGTEHS